MREQGLSEIAAPLEDGLATPNEPGVVDAVKLAEEPMKMTRSL